jgi:hypothetical protein
MSHRVGNQNILTLESKKNPACRLWQILFSIAFSPLHPLLRKLHHSGVTWVSCLDIIYPVIYTLDPFY